MLGRLFGGEQQKTQNLPPRSEDFTIVANCSVLDGIRDTEALVKTLNEEEDTWRRDAVFLLLKMYVTVFGQTKSQELSVGCWNAYLALGAIKPRDAHEVCLMHSWFMAISIKMTSMKPANALRQSLLLIDRSIFTEPIVLTTLAKKILDMMDSKSKDFAKNAKKQDMESMVVVLEQIFDLLCSTSSEFVDIAKNEYIALIKRLSEIKANQKFYSVFFHSALIEQNLRRTEKRGMFTYVGKMCGRGWSGASAVVNLAQATVKISTGDFGATENFGNAYKDAVASLTKTTVTKDPCFDDIFELQDLALEACQNHDKYDQFLQSSEEAIEKYGDTMGRRAQRKKMIYAVVVHVSLIARDAYNKNTREEALNWLVGAVKKNPKGSIDVPWKSKKRYLRGAFGRIWQSLRHDRKKNRSRRGN